MWVFVDRFDEVDLTVRGVNTSIDYTSFRLSALRFDSSAPLPLLRKRFHKLLKGRIRSSAAFLHLIEIPPVAFRRPSGSGLALGSRLAGIALDFRNAGIFLCRGEIGETRGGLFGTDSALEGGPDLKGLCEYPLPDLDLIPGPDQLRSPATLPVDKEVPFFAGGSSEAPRFVETHRPSPQIDPDSFFGTVGCALHWKRSYAVVPV